jgi:hypothetical protein
MSGHQAFAGWLRSIIRPRWPVSYPAERNAMASTASHPTITSATTAPAVILAFSLVV